MITIIIIIIIIIICPAYSSKLISLGTWFTVSVCRAVHVTCVCVCMCKCGYYFKLSQTILKFLLWVIAMNKSPLHSVAEIRTQTHPLG